MPLLTLLAPDGQPAAGRTLSLPPEGLALTLRVPAAPPAHHLEPTQVRLTLSAPSGVTTLTGGGAGLTVVTSLGALSANWADEQNDTKGGVKWLTADWGARRTLVSIKLTSKAGAADTARARLKVATGSGPWFPPLPVDTVPLNSEQALPDIVADRLMVELVKPDTNNVLQPAASFLTGLTLTFASQPVELSAALGDAPPLFQNPGRLLPSTQVVVDRPLLDAVARDFPRDGKPADLRVTLRGTVQGQVTVSAVQLGARAVYERLATPAPGDSVSLPWAGEALGQLTVGEGVLDEVRFTVAPDLIPERLLTDPRPPPAFTYACLGDVDHVPAQGFTALPGAPLAGVDLWLRPGTPRVAGTLALHPDDQGQPGPTPFGGAVMPLFIEETGPRPWHSRWVPLTLPKPLRLDAGPWWLVLTVSEGEAFWPLGFNAPTLARPVPLRRPGHGAWTPWGPPPAPTERPWARCRLRAASTTPAPDFEVELRRGTGRLVVTPGADGRVSLTRAQLAGLASGPVLGLAVRTHTVPVSGGIRFEDVRIAIQPP